MKVVIDGTLELDLAAPPRQGEIIAWGDDARRVESVVWIIPDIGQSGGAPTAEDVVVHVKLQKHWRERAGEGGGHRDFPEDRSGGSA
ncbi:hypothetical protein [Streptomyces xanthochromogenes]